MTTTNESIPTDIENQNDSNQIEPSEVQTKESNNNEMTTETTGSTEEPVLSKSQKKKLLKNERWEKMKDQKKAYLKQKKKEKEKKRKEMMTDEERLQISEIKKKKKRDPTQIEYSGSIVFDFEMTDQMGEKEEKSLVTQMCFLYGVNRKAERPFHLSVTGFNGRIKPLFEKMSGFSMWHMDCFAETYMEKYEKSELVYLTSDSPNIIKTLDPTKKYIIGGLVDHNRLKGITFKKATEQGIAHAQLPISEYIQLASRKILAVNHVFEILSKFTECNDWKEAFEKVIPLRKFTEKKKKKNNKEGDDNNNDDDDDEDEDDEDEGDEEEKEDNDNEKDTNSTTTTSTTTSSPNPMVEN